MSLLLDTHVVVWLFEASPKLPAHVRDRLASGEELFVSFASAWEYSNKRRLKPHDMRASFQQILESAPFRHLSCELSIGRYAETLPPIHKDPFDRMLIAQALEHRLTLVTADARVKKYPVDTFW